MTADDLPLVRHWLAEPHVVRWWGNLSSNSISSEAISMNWPWTSSSWCRDARPFAYLQCYDPEVLG